MSLDGPNVQDGFSSAGTGVTRFTKGQSPIARAYRGITQEQGKYIAHIEIDGKEYSFDIDEVKINDDGIFVADALTKNGFETIPLSQQAMSYIQARKNALDYVEIMDLSGQVGGHYGHNPDFDANAGITTNPAFEKG